MRTARQREASRINGARSRGPVTSIGKQKSSRNSRRHGLYAKDIPIVPPSGHEPAELPDLHAQALHDELAALYPAPNSPNSEYERLLQCALDAHRDCMRIVFLETRIMREEIARQRLIPPEESEVSLAALAFRRLADETGTMLALCRLDGVMIRREERALDRLERFSERAHRLQNTFFQKTEICQTNLGANSESAAFEPDAEAQSPAPEIEKNEICETNPGTRATCHHAQTRITHPKQTYNRRVAIKGAYVEAKTAHLRKNPRVSRCRPVPCPNGARAGPNHEAADARPHPPRGQRRPPDRLPWWTVR